MLKNNLKEIRRSKNISQEEVAQALHISRQSLSEWENQRGNPDLENLVALSKFYGVPINALIDETIPTECTAPDDVPDQNNTDKTSYDPNLMILYVTVLIVSTFISFIGIGVSTVLLIKLRKKKFPKIFYVLCIVCLVISIFNFCVLLNSYFFHLGTVTIQEL